MPARLGEDYIRMLCKVPFSIKMSGSELQPRKVELRHMHSKNVTSTESILHITTKPVLYSRKIW